MPERRTLTLRFRDRYVRGAANHRTRLTEEQARTILTSPERGTVLAKRFGVTKAAVYDVRKRRSWAWLKL